MYYAMFSNAESNNIRLNALEKFSSSSDQKHVLKIQTNEQTNATTKIDTHLPWTLFFFFIITLIQDTARIDNTC